MLQKVGMTAAPGMLAKNGIRQFERYSGPLTPQQRTAMDRWLPTLDRVLTARVGMNGLLAGKWLYVTSLGVVQICVMFLWAMLVFKLDLLHHLPGFAVMTVVTAAAAAAFGLVLATLCRTRQQLSGISTIVILTLSALGGSMFPRFLMSPAMQRMGLFTFNGWALDGYIKVFWREARVPELAPQVGVLLAFMVAFLVVARLLARRWERG